MMIRVARDATFMEQFGELADGNVPSIHLPYSDVWWNSGVVAGV